MQRRRTISALLAVGLTVGLAWAAPAAHASADPYTMTNGFYVNPDNSAAVWSAANPGDGREPAIDCEAFIHPPLNTSTDPISIN